MLTLKTEFANNFDLTFLYYIPFALNNMKGTKTDLDDLRSVELDDVRAFAAHHNIFDVIETSAKIDCNVEDAFYKMAYELKRIHGDSNPAIKRSHSNLVLPDEKKSKLNCCGL